MWDLDHLYCGMVDYDNRLTNEKYGMYLAVRWSDVSNRFERIRNRQSNRYKLQEMTGFDAVKRDPVQIQLKPSRDSLHAIIQTSVYAQLLSCSSDA